jgi:tight adherence protein C
VAALLATLALAVLYRLAVPARSPLAADLARLLDPLGLPGATTISGRGHLVGQLTLTAQRRGWLGARLRRDLLVAEQGADWLVARCLGAALAVAAVLAAFALALMIGGLALPTTVIVSAGAAGAAGALLLPGYLLRQQAQQRREAMLHTLPGLLDLTGVLLAAGNSLEAAVRAAAEVGADWPHQQIQQALYAAVVSRQPASEALQELGVRLDVQALTQLGDGLLMAEREGASMRASMAARARGLRERQLADVEAKAGSATEGMSFPLVAFVLGFVVLIGYPALIGLSTGLGSR